MFSGWSAAFLDISLLLATLISILQLGNMMLDQAQQKAIQSRLETWTLRMSYVNVINAFHRFMQTAPGKAILITGVSSLFLLRAITSFRTEVTAYQHDTQNALLPLLPISDWQAFRKLYGSGELLARFALILFFAGLLWTGVGWLARSPNLVSFIRKSAVIAIIGISVFAFALLHGPLDPNDWTAWSIIALGLLPFVVWTWAVSALIVAAFFHIAVWLTKNILWRIVEYKDGAWAGLVYFVTGTLGLVKLVLLKKE
jgi:hypothetical protein